ncbi:hypothetical protein F0U59_17410 [Archangium gephyra]|nr:hypothetical protein F0U59_17410 [Archangium gephyra]
MRLIPSLPDTPRSVFTELRELLADTYRDRPAIEHFLQEREEVRLKIRDIDLSHSAAVSWQNILERSHQEGTLDKLLLEVAKDRRGIASRVIQLADTYVQTLPLSRIRREFARLFPSVQALEDVLGRFNAEPSLEGRAPLFSSGPSAPPGNTPGDTADLEAHWQAVLEQAHSYGSLPELVRFVARERPDDADELEQHLLDYHLLLDPDDPKVDLLQGGNPMLSEWFWLKRRLGRLPRRARSVLGSVWPWVLLWEVASLTAIQLSDHVGASCMSFDIVRATDGNKLATVHFGYRYELNHAFLNLFLAPGFFLLGTYFLKRVGRSLNEWIRRRYLVAIEASGPCTARQVVARLKRINRRWAWATGLIVTALASTIIRGEYETRIRYWTDSSKATFGWVQADLLKSQEERLQRFFQESSDILRLHEDTRECFATSSGKPGAGCKIQNVHTDAHNHPRRFPFFLGLALALQQFLFAYLTFIFMKICLVASLLLTSLFNEVRISKGTVRPRSSPRLVLKLWWEDRRGRLGLESSDKFYAAAMGLLTLQSIVLPLQAFSNSLKGEHADPSALEFWQVWNIAGNPGLIWAAQLLMTLAALAMLISVPLFSFFGHTDDAKDQHLAVLTSLLNQAQSHGLPVEHLQARYARVSEQTIWFGRLPFGLFFLNLFLLLILYLPLTIHGFMDWTVPLFEHIQDIFC